MKKIIFISVFLLFSTWCFASDTTFYENGKIQMIYQSYHFHTSYYRNGQVETHSKCDSFFLKGKQVNYDSLGDLISKGKIVFGSRKHGRWKYYENGKKRIVKYKYGVEKSELKTPEGKRIKCILTYGLGAGWNHLCDSAVEKYRVRYVAVAGCVVNNRIFLKTGIHNFFIVTPKILRFGTSWEDKMGDMCGKNSGF